MWHEVREFWVFNTLRCVLAAVGDPPILFVQIVIGDRAVYAQRVKSQDEGPQVASDLWATFVEPSS